MKKLIVLAFFIGSFSALKAQSTYSTAIGVKFYPTGVTVKHFISAKHSLEGIGYFYNYGTRITGLYELNFDIKGVDGLRWYVGPGAHVGIYNSKYGGGTAIGVDGVLGLDYKFATVPINLSLDWQPSFEFGDKFNNGFAGNWGGIGIRYTF